MSIVKEISSIASIAMPVAERWHVRRCRYTPGEEALGRICIATGIHGDEMLGQLIAFSVAQRITANPQHLHGTVDIYPMLNPMGLDIGERMTPMMNHLDMNRAFPGSAAGTALEAMCHAIYTDMLGADLVLDIHAGTKGKSELYEVRLDYRNQKMMIPQAQALAPDIIWVYADKSAFSATLSASLCAAGTPAMVLEVDERRRNPRQVAQRVTDSIFCKMKEMGLWSGDSAPMPAPGTVIPTILSGENIERVSCETPGMYVPEDCVGKWLKAGDSLGVIIDALEGVTLETVTAPKDGLCFSQRSYSAVYPGTLIARLFIPGKDGVKA